jgi:hypothetical protein
VHPLRSCAAPLPRLHTLCTHTRHTLTVALPLCAASSIHVQLPAWVVCTPLTHTRGLPTTGTTCRGCPPRSSTHRGCPPYSRARRVAHTSFRAPFSAHGPSPAWPPCAWPPLSLMSSQYPYEWGGAWCSLGRGTAPEWKGGGTSPAPFAMRTKEGTRDDMARQVGWPARAG